MEKKYTNLKTKADKNIEKTDGRHINDTGSKQTDSSSHKEIEREKERNENCVFVRISGSKIN